jgi:hypothetical protein
MRAKVLALNAAAITAAAMSSWIGDVNSFHRSTVHDNLHCAGLPFIATYLASNCEENNQCYDYSTFSSTSDCVESYRKEDFAALMGPSPYIIDETYNEGCEKLTIAVAIQADGKCYPFTSRVSKRVIIDVDKTINIFTYNGLECQDATPTVRKYTKDKYNSGQCHDLFSKIFYMQSGDAVENLEEKREQQENEDQEDIMDANFDDDEEDEEQNNNKEDEDTSFKKHEAIASEKLKKLFLPL